MGGSLSAPQGLRNAKLEQKRKNGNQSTNGTERNLFYYYYYFQFYLHAIISLSKVTREKGIGCFQGWETEPQSPVLISDALSSKIVLF